MPKKVINSFNSGELSPYLYARSDFEKYSSGCLVMENATPLPYGGAVRRPAIEMIAESFADDKIRGLAFTSSIASSYFIEFGTGYLRVYKDGVLITFNGAPLSIGTPYTDTDLLGLKVAQSIDVMWLVHPDYPVQRLSRFSDTSWSLSPEEFDFPPLRLENDTDITMSPSATTGSITLTSSRDFFDSGHVGAHMTLRSIRDLQNKSDSGNLTSSKFTNEIGVSNSHWSITLTAVKDNRVTLQRSLDGGTIWEDYIRICDVIGSSNARSFSAASEDPEPFNSVIRLHVIEGTTGAGEFEVIIGNIYFESLVKITGYTSATEVEAEVIGEFQDVPADYSEHSDSTSYSTGDKVKVSSSISYTTVTEDLKTLTRLSLVSDSFKWTLSASGTNEYYLELLAGGDPGVSSFAPVTAVEEDGGAMVSGSVGSLAAGEYDYGDNDTLGYSTVYVRLTDGVDPDTKVESFLVGAFTSSVSANITDVTGATWGNDFYWITTNGISNISMYKLLQSGGTWTLVNGYDLSSDFTSIADTAWDSNLVYVTGVLVASDLGDKIYDESMVLQSTVDFPDNPSQTGVTAYGLEISDSFYYNSYSFTEGGTFYDVMYKLNLSDYTWTGLFVWFANAGEGRFEDMLESGGIVFTLNSIDTSVVLYDTSFNSLRTLPIPGGSTSPRGILEDDSNVWIIDDDGNIYQYDINPLSQYYEYIFTASDTDDFATQYSEGRWSERTPEMETWSEGAFSDYRGHPQAVALFESHLCYAGTASDPDTLWLSVIDDFQNFRLGSLATDAMQLTLNSGNYDEIRWLLPSEALIIGTAGSEWSLGPSTESEAITPTSFNLKRRTTYGSANIQAALVNSAVLFPMRQKRKVREWTFQFEAQDYVAPDLSILAEHITDGGIEQWAFQQQPDNILWSIRADGTLLCFVYERDQNVVGWCRFILEDGAGEFESVAVIPREGEEDEVWVTCKLTVDGNTKRYIGRFMDREWGVASTYATNYRGSDFYTVFTSPGTATLTGLDYHEGKTLDVVADGVVQDQETVSGGSITVDSDAYTTIVVGLHYDSKVTPIYIEPDDDSGSGQGRRKNIRRAVLRYKDTFSSKAGRTADKLETVRFDQDQTPLYNDEREVFLDNSSDFIQTCHVVQDEPMPWTLLAMIVEVEQ